MKPLTKQDTIQQSQEAYRQWRGVWQQHAKDNGAEIKKRETYITDLLGAGQNRIAVVVATGASLEKHIESLKKYQTYDGVDIITNDKSFGLLLERGIFPKYVIVADAVVSYEDWCEKYIDKTKDVTLFGAVTANPKWLKNWQGPAYFYVCKDSIQSEIEMSQLSGIEECLPASATVANASVIVAANVMEYSEILLVGFDYSWYHDQNYYAFSENLSEDKRYWQKSENLEDINGRIAYSSKNLVFAARWIENFYKAIIEKGEIKSYVFNCSEQGIIRVPKSTLKERIEQFKFNSLTPEQKNAINTKRVRGKRVNKSEEFKKIGQESNVFFADVFYVPKKAMMA
jgi:hypothetical protein